MKMNSACPSCRLRFESEPGFYQISMFINLVLTFVSATLVTAGLFYADILTLEGLWLFPILMAIFPLIFLRVSRSIWLAVMYRFAPEEFVAAKESSPAAASRTH
jgi:hypothetical protein